MIGLIFLIIGFLIMGVVLVLFGVEWFLMLFFRWVEKKVIKITEIKKHLSQYEGRN